MMPLVNEAIQVATMKNPKTQTQLHTVISDTPLRYPTETSRNP
jgi:hypothetical protein